jgi:hypothetical protein
MDVDSDAPDRRFQAALTANCQPTGIAWRHSAGVAGTDSRTKPTLPDARGLSAATL